MKGILEIFLDAFLGDLKSLTDFAEIGVKLYGEVGSLIIFILLDLKVNRFLCSADVGAYGMELGLGWPLTTLEFFTLSS